MSAQTFMEMLEAKWDEGKFVCVGLDSEYEKIPEFVRNRYRHVSDLGVAGATIAFNRAIVDVTKDVACAYKLNSAFYEAHGDKGIFALQRSIQDIHGAAPDVPVILDAKRADIGNTNEGYAKFAFDYCEADALTVHPYLGEEALKPFLKHTDKGIFVLCRTSNPGAGEFQDLVCSDREALYEKVADRVSGWWNQYGNCALVVGATVPEELGRVRMFASEIPILIPGIGAQGGDLEKSVRAAKNSQGNGFIINSSRGIIFASKGEDFLEAARREALKLHDLVNRYR